MAMRPGDQLSSTVCSTRVIVIRATVGDSVTVACGGAPMVPAGTLPGRPDGAAKPGTLIGKRYVDATGAVELLCTASGAGELMCDGMPMTVKAPKPLPASD
jgi:hypothetical protein